MKLDPTFFNGNHAVRSFVLLIFFVGTASAASETFKNLTDADYQKRIDRVAKLGHTPVAIKVRVEDGADYYTLETIPRRSVWATHHRMTQKMFDAKMANYKSKGFQVAAKQSYELNGKVLFVAIWKEIPRKPILFWEAESKVPVSGRSIAQLKPFDDLMRKFLVEQQLPGATLAISRNGKMIFSRGYGFSDFQNKKRMPQNALMRIASISKPLTAVAILKLVEQKKLKLSDKVFDVIPHQPYNTKAPVDPRLAEVTVLQCLQHTGGWDRGVSFDPMFRDIIISKALNVPCPPGKDNIIRYMLNQPLDHEPGTTYAYSNFGYNVLGRVIEEVSGQSYEQYVQKAVLKPISVHRMEIGSTLKTEKNPSEPIYYARKNRRRAAVVGRVGEMVSTPYGAWHLEAMDSHGAWIASASDLVKFAAALDDRVGSKLLAKQSIETMFARPAGKLGLDQNGAPKASFYGCGWMVRPMRDRENSWHGGLLDGTSTLLVRRYDGLNWAVLFNKADCKDGKTPSGKIDPLLHQAAAKVKNWPK